jgi:hypothetical protein
MADVTKEIVLKVSANDATGPALQSLEDKLNAVKKRMVELAAAGKQNTEEFQRLQVEAGGYKRTIEGVEQSVDSFAKGGSRALTLMVEASQAVAAGFAIAQGAAALFGDENEDLQKAMLQVQGAMALVNGVQQVSILLTQKSVITTEAAAAAQRLYAFTLGQSTVALRLFRTALVATGIGAATVAIGLLVENWSKLVKVVKDFLGIQTENLKADAEIAQRQLELAEARGESEKKLQQLLMASYDARIKAADDEEEKAQLMHEKEVARIQYETKLRTDAAAKRKEINDELKSMDKAATDADAALRMAKIGRINDELARERALRDERLAILREEKATRDAELKKQFTNENDYAKAYALLTEEMRAKEQTIAEESSQKILEIQNNRRQKELQMASQAVAALGDLLTAGLGQSEKDQRKAFEINKKSSIAQALINTYQAVTAALTAGGNPIKLATGAQFIDAGIALAAGLANVVKISKTQFQTSGGGGGGSMSLPSGGGTSSTPAPVFANPQTTMLGTDGAALNGQGQGMQPMRAYVVERDIQQTTSRVRRLSEFATLG